jgi:hypothetical protein
MRLSYLRFAVKTFSDPFSSRKVRPCTWDHDTYLCLKHSLHGMFRNQVRWVPGPTT